MCDVELSLATLNIVPEFCVIMDLQNIATYLVTRVVRVSGYRARGSGFDSQPLPDFLRQQVWNGVHSAS
jgi:hypothetical protein